MKNDIPYASYWLAAVRSRYACPNDWQSWADAIILKSRDVPKWILELSTVSDDCVDQLLRAEVGREVQRGIQSPSIDDAALGYLWLRYERHEITIVTCLESAGRMADSSQATVDCEGFYELLNRIEMAGHESKEINDVLLEARKEFATLKIIAEHQWAIIHDDV